MATRADIGIIGGSGLYTFLESPRWVEVDTPFGAPSAPLARPTTPDEAYAAYQAAYADEPFVTLLPRGAWPMTQSIVGSNGVHLQVTVDAAANRLVAVCAIDNLTKGTAGGAIQSMNIALGLPETLGLTSIGVAP